MASPANWLIKYGDCRDVLPRARSVDLIIADPPYAATSLGWDKRVEDWQDTMLRILKPSGSLWVFGSLRSTLVTHDHFRRWNLAQELIWEKHNGSGPVSSRRFNRVHEFVLQYYRGKWSDVYADQQKTDGHERIHVQMRTSAPAHRPDFKPCGYDSTQRIQRSVQRVRSPHRSAIHPTEKPVDLLRLLVRYSCPPGGLVVDPFCGSGSTGEAAILEGRDFLGAELDRDYVTAARSRLGKL